MSTLLVELSDEERRRMRSLLSGCPQLELRAGSTRAAHELPDAVLFVVDGGTVALVHSGEAAARRIVLSLAVAGDVLVPPGHDDHLAALADARLTAVPRAAYRELLARPESAAAIAASLVDAVCERERSLAIFGRFPHVDRVRGKLLQLARSHGRVSERGIVIRLALTHDLLSEMVGSARETVTWAMRELLDEGFVSREGRLYRVHVTPEQVHKDRRRPRR